MEKVKHFSHIHPLMLKEEQKKDDEKIFCLGCEKPISGPVYCCDQCNYVLHKSCAELPPQMKHPFHPQHPLILLSTSPYNGGLCLCDACRVVCNKFVYHCPLCHYDLDIACASQWCPNDGHSHAFISLTNPTSFVCYACGETARERLSCVCSICQIWVHSSCAKLPQDIRINCHNHRLKLSYTLHHVSGFKDGIICGVCNGTMSSAFAGYFCSSCDYSVHLKCSQQHLINDYWDASTADEESEIDGFQDLGFSLFSHDHLLKFMEELSLEYDDKLCDGCIQPVKPPFFSCSKNCGFLIHQSCAKLPRMKKHPFHRHPLTLLSKAPPFDGIYRCDGCRWLSNGFVYRCDECQFDLDVSCGSLPETIEHESHSHTLFLKKTSVPRQCKGCHLRSNHVFECDVCEDYAIDCGCATLPCKAWHMYDKHPLSLTFFVVGELTEYECGICNEKMLPKHWFYYCDDCDFGAHISCVVGKCRRVKFGGTFQYDAHSHPLALVEENKGDTTCKACGIGCNGWTLECGQCRCYFHREGKCFWEQFKKSAKFLALTGKMRHTYTANVLAATPNVTTK